jgi:hypothetical protein
MESVENYEVLFYAVRPAGEHGGGAALSTDAGESWQPADEGRDRHA